MGISSWVGAFPEYIPPRSHGQGSPPDGYDPEHGDWFSAKYQPDGTVDAAGRVASCQDCHADGDEYVLTDDFGAPGNG